MAVAFVREVSLGSSKTAGTTIAGSTSQAVTAGNLLVVVVLSDNAATVGKPIVSSITKAASETATWTLLGRSTHPSSTTSGAFANGEIWALKTTVTWAQFTSVTVTWDTSITMRAATLLEFSGAEATARSTAGTAYSTTTTAASATTTGTAPVIGDLALGFTFGSNVAAAQAGDTDTTGGSWSSVSSLGSTGGNAATNNFGIAQYKIVTSTSHQTYNNSAAMTAGNGAIVAVLQASIEPLVTQAAYRVYADGPESDTLVDTYPVANYVGGLSVQVATASAYGQAFLGNGGAFIRAGFYMAKAGTPNGTFTASLYSHTGTYGSTGVPDTLLATSTTTPRQSTDLTTSPAWVYFEFDPTVTLASGTPYFVAVSSTNTNASGVLVGIDNTSPSHAGTCSRFVSGAWSVLSGADLIFEAYTKAASDPLAAQDTAPTIDVSGGDQNLGLRMRLQETAGGLQSVATDWQLQWEKNASGTWADVVSTTALEASSFSGVPSFFGGTTAPAMLGQQFAGNGQALKRLRFDLRRETTTTATFTAKLYSSSGASLGTGLPVTEIAASTTTIAASTLAAISMTSLFFEFDGTFTLVNGTRYFAVVTTTATVNGEVSVGTESSAKFSGVAAQFLSSWSAYASDLAYGVYTAPTVCVPYDSPNLTDAAATTNRLTGGTGTFVAGKVSEDGLVDDVGITVSNYTELLYSLTLKQADLSNADTLRFRVLRDGATTGMTYTAVPTINVTSGSTSAARFQSVQTYHQHAVRRASSY